MDFFFTLNVSGKQVENQKANLLGNDLVASQNEKLREAIQVGYQTQEIAFGSEVELARNSETMKRSIKNMGGIHRELTWSNRLLGDIKKNINKNKMVLYGVFGFIGIVVILLASVKLLF